MVLFFQVRLENNLSRQKTKNLVNGKEKCTHQYWESGILFIKMSNLMQLHSCWFCASRWPLGVAMPPKAIMAGLGQWVRWLGVKSWKHMFFSGLSTHGAHAGKILKNTWVKGPLTWHSSPCMPECGYVCLLFLQYGKPHGAIIQTRRAAGSSGHKAGKS